VNSDEFPVDPGAPLFFLSYAHGRQSPLGQSTVQAEVSQYVVHLFQDLSIHVSELVGLPTGADPGFMDAVMGGGQQWTPELLRATGTCQVFVALISPSLIRSQWCGLEWHAFTRRPVKSRNPHTRTHETAVIPVTWSATPKADLPLAVARIQRFNPVGLPDPQVELRYRDEGIYGLRTLGLDNAYKAVVWRLAQRIVAVRRSLWVQEMIPEHESDLDNVFTDREGR